MSPRFLYSLFMLLALCVFVVTRHLLPKSTALKGLTWFQQLMLAAAAFIGGVLGAKLPFALASEEYWWAAGAWLADGKTVTTGLVGAYLAVELTKLALGLRVKTGDSFALPLALALAVGRWGCFFNGCCHGTVTDLPWGVDFGDGIPRHPTQIYESFFHAVLALVLWKSRDWKSWRHQQLKFYLIAYCGYRIATEFIRPEPPLAWGMNFYQWTCLFFALFLVGQAVVDHRRRHDPVCDE
jgi:phosphatidylglycerol:prolipoprotein diacylglycerol transferase